MAGISTFSSSPSSAQPPKGRAGIAYGRVVDIILDEGTTEEEKEKFKRNGEWAGVGTIFYKSVTVPVGDNQLKTEGTKAFPYFPNFKHYPLIGEIVPIIQLPSPTIGVSTTTDTISYYLPPTNIWNTVHHNAYPYLPGLPPSQQKSYAQSEAGSLVKDAPQQSQIEFGKTFIQRDNIRDLLAFEGDVIVEGRWGNTIRLGSTVTSRPNTWSSVGTCGDPLIIIRNGQNQPNPTPIQQPEVEDINKEGSSVYLTSTQSIPIQTPTAEETHSSGKSSYHKFYPTPPSQYNKGTQAIISGDRVIINAKKDHVLIDARLTLSFNAQKGFNFDTPKNFVVKTGTTIRLGKEFAPHPLIKGDKMVNLLDSLINELSNLAITLQSVPVPGMEGVKAASTILVPKLAELKASLPATKSTKTFTL